MQAWLIKRVGIDMTKHTFTGMEMMNNGIGLYFQEKYTKHCVTHHVSWTSIESEFDYNS